MEKLEKLLKEVDNIQKETEKEMNGEFDINKLIEFADKSINLYNEIIPILKQEVKETKEADVAKEIEEACDKCVDAVEQIKDTKEKLINLKTEQEEADKLDKDE